MTGYFHVLTAIDLFVLSFMCILTKLSESLNKNKSEVFPRLCTYCGDFRAGGGHPCRQRHAVRAALAEYRVKLLRLRPVASVSLCLVYVLDKKTALRRGFKAAVCCEIAYLIFLALSIPYGLIFSVSADNVYARGRYFYIYVIVYFAAILYLSVSTIITGREFQNRSRALIYPLMLFLTAETVIQIALLICM